MALRVPSHYPIPVRAELSRSFRDRFMLRRDMTSADVGTMRSVRPAVSLIDPQALHDRRFFRELLMVKNRQSAV